MLCVLWKTFYFPVLNYWISARPVWNPRSTELYWLDDFPCTNHQMSTALEQLNLWKGKTYCIPSLQRFDRTGIMWIFKLRKSTYSTTDSRKSKSIIVVVWFGLVCCWVVSRSIRKHRCQVPWARVLGSKYFVGKVKVLIIITLNLVAIVFNCKVCTQSTFVLLKDKGYKDKMYLNRFQQHIETCILIS